MKYTGVIRIVCPYCGHENQRFASEHWPPTADGRVCLLCDVDEGPGCGRLFAAEIRLRPVITTYSMTEAHFTPLYQDILDEEEAAARFCQYQDIDGTCTHYLNKTPECTEAACPLDVPPPSYLEERLARQAERSIP